jgi:hypothetical protein
MVLLNNVMPWQKVPEIVNDVLVYKKYNQDIPSDLATKVRHYHT